MRFSPHLLLLTLWVGQPAAASVDLTSLSIEDLMDLEVSLTSRTEKRVFETPAAVFVLTAEDLRRSGATSLPEALRLVPGIEVARLDASKWGVAARGFNGRFANKLLVLIDGRAVYTPFYSGVMWEIRDVMLDEVERIEVIRGPGGTLWGANAVNGIINVVRAPAGDTPGTFVRVSAGDEERGRIEARHGSALGERTDLRVSGHGFAHDSFVDSVGADGQDDWHMGRVGFRLDRRLRRGTLAVHGDIYRGQRGQVYRFASLTPPYIDLTQDDTKLSGGYLQADWERDFVNGSQVRGQIYYDRTSWSDVLIGEARDTWDVDLQQRLPAGQRHELVWGLGLRVSRDDIESTPNFALDPSSRVSPLYSAFLQDEIRLGPQWRLAVGTKVEHNDYTGVEMQPSVRLRWLRGRQAAWAALSRAVRTPSRAEDDARLRNRTLPPNALFPDTPAALIYNVGDRGVVSETLIAAEAGYRLRPLDGMSVDLAAFYHRYEDLRMGGLRLPVFVDEPVAHVIVELPSANDMEATTWGSELALDWRDPAGGRRLRGAYSWLHMEVTAFGLANPVAEFEEGASPEHRLSLWPSIDLPGPARVDAMLRFVDRLPFYDINRYTELDVRLAWSLGTGMEVALSGHSLLAKDHEEFSDLFVNTAPTRTQRGLQLSWSARL